MYDEIDKLVDTTIVAEEIEKAAEAAWVSPLVGGALGGGIAALATKKKKNMLRNVVGGILGGSAAGYGYDALAGKGVTAPLTPQEPTAPTLSKAQRRARYFLGDTKIPGSGIGVGGVGVLDAAALANLGIQGELGRQAVARKYGDIGVKTVPRALQTSSHGSASIIPGVEGPGYATRGNIAEKGLVPALDKALKVGKVSEVKRQAAIAKVLKDNSKGLSKAKIEEFLKDEYVKRGKKLAKGSNAANLARQRTQGLATDVNEEYGKWLKSVEGGGTKFVGSKFRVRPLRRAGAATLPLALGRLLAPKMEEF